MFSSMKEKKQLLSAFESLRFSDFVKMLMENLLVATLNVLFVQHGTHLHLMKQNQGRKLHHLM